MNNASILSVYLNQLTVGHLTLLPGERILFTFDESYINQTDHPILSLSFYDKLNQLITNPRPTQLKAPPFFSNLLPEGHLRTYLAKLASIHTERDFRLLELMGEDLPGAVIIKPETIPATATSSTEHVHSYQPPEVLKFSLAGIQLKFSALQETQGGLTIPAHGVGGNKIIKLPSYQFNHVAENEYAMMQLANRVGIETPDLQLTALNKIQGLPELPERLPKQAALVVNRFDRNKKNQRVHMEDLAQLYGLYPHNKYNKVSYDNLLKMMMHVAGTNDALALLQRIVFSALIGNADMHLKNITLLYPEGNKPVLSPAYDLVSTITYINDTTMALNLSGTKNMFDYNLTLIQKAAEKAQLPITAATKMAKATIEKTLAQWPEIQKQGILSKQHAKIIDTHMQMVAMQFK